ncbi:MAG: hypothetical protein ACOC6I_03190, partial [Candidatus Bipolaricaulota bacterium]
MRKFNILQQKQEVLGDGVERTVIQGDSLEFIQYSYKGGSTFPVHSHPSEQMTVVLKGTLIFRFPQSGAEEELTL